MSTLAVTGGRDFDNEPALRAFLDHMWYVWRCDHVALGDCPTGADCMAHSWARGNSIPISKYDADWTAYKKAAGPIRNKQMLLAENPEYVIGFVGGSGTRNCIRTAVDVTSAVVMHITDIVDMPMTHIYKISMPSKRLMLPYKFQQLLYKK